MRARDRPTAYVIAQVRSTNVRKPCECHVAKIIMTVAIAPTSTDADNVKAGEWPRSTGIWLVERFSYNVLKNARLQSMWSKLMKHCWNIDEASLIWAQCDQCPLHTRTNWFTDSLANDAIIAKVMGQK